MTASDATRIASLHQIFDEGITPHQKDIALMYAFGFTFDEIADDKGISLKTVNYHISEVKNSLGGVTLNGLRSIILLRLISNLLRIYL